jgi:hypothetical protein
VPPQTLGRVIALTRVTPPPETGLSHWLTRTLADHLNRREGIRGSFHQIAHVWREENLKPHRSGTFTLAATPRELPKNNFSMHSALLYLRFPR